MNRGKHVQMSIFQSMRFTFQKRLIHTGRQKKYGVNWQGKPSVLVTGFTEKFLSCMNWFHCIVQARCGPCLLPLIITVDGKLYYTTALCSLLHKAKFISHSKQFFKGFFLNSKCWLVLVHKFLIFFSHQGVKLRRIDWRCLIATSWDSINTASIRTQRAMLEETCVGSN